MVTKLWNIWMNIARDLAIVDNGEKALIVACVGYDWGWRQTKKCRDPSREGALGEQQEH